MMKWGFVGRGRPPEGVGRYSAIVLVGALAMAMVMAAPLSAKEVYSWTDENGVTHFSDTPRASGDDRIIEAEEAYRPGSVEAQPIPSPEAADAAEQALSPAQARRAALRENAQTRREKQAEQEQLCSLHRQRLEQMEPARRVYYLDDAGNEVRMDDNQRMELIAESRTFLDDNCGD
jgi:hypothetical protein